MKKIEMSLNCFSSETKIYFCSLPESFEFALLQVILTVNMRPTLKFRKIAYENLKKTIFKRFFHFFQLLIC